MDVIDMTCDLDKYKVLALSMVLYVQGRFCRKGSCVCGKRRYTDHKLLVGIADDTDRCYLEGTPHGLMDVLGIRSTEIDGLYDWEEKFFFCSCGW